MLNKILIVFGTRPEAIKMAPVVKVLENKFIVEVCVTAQHRQMLDQVLDVFEIIPQIDLDIMRPNQDLFDITSKILIGMKNVISKVNPDLVLVHGDTTTAMTTALAAFYSGVSIGHIEAGLRTHDVRSPFPEELNRQIVSKISNFHFAPTKKSEQNLLNEGINKEKIFVVGNTVIDALLFAQKKAKITEFSPTLKKSLPFLNDLDNKKKKLILITGHRRENFGQGFKNICEALRELSLRNKDIEFIYPVHLNPNVQKPVKAMLSKIKNVNLIKPLDYLPFVKLMESSYLILTDSGGIQEEAPSLGKPVLVMRNNTERPEAIKSGTVKLVGTEKNNIYKNVQKLIDDKAAYKSMSESRNPYGDGKSSSKIMNILLKSIK